MEGIENSSFVITETSIENSDYDDENSPDFKPKELHKILLKYLKENGANELADLIKPCKPYLAKMVDDDGSISYWELVYKCDSNTSHKILKMNYIKYTKDVCGIGPYKYEN